MMSFSWTKLSLEATLVKKYIQFTINYRII